MDKRIKYRIIIDTETCPINPESEDVFGNGLTYDIGWAIVDKRGKVYAKRSCVVKEIFYGESDRMKSSYYASKIPQYVADIASGKRVVLPFNVIRMTINADISNFGVSEIYAHNIGFDNRALDDTRRWIEGEGADMFFPLEIQLCDTNYMAHSVIKKTPTYRQFCLDNNYLTAMGHPQTKAEILYRYISCNNSFEESHTGLEDVLIEKEIMRYCFAKHKSMNRFYNTKRRKELQVQMGLA